MSSVMPVSRQPSLLVAKCLPPERESTSSIFSWRHRFSGQSISLMMAFTSSVPALSQTASRALSAWLA